ncbi:RICIN domain-containing protein, partial [Streptomyces ziwulingensis]|uniref:RICIN domain-containing protein n=1 Tax=Streptomyces ziwulingensis TaxID=1045501 RepID=UPI0031F006B0
ITPFTEVRAELVPSTVKGRFRGKPRLAVDNLGNTKVTASVAGSDTGDRLGYELRPANVQVEPGRAVFVDAVLRPRQTIWFGSKEEHPYKLAVQRSGVAPLDVEGTFVQRGFLPRWLATFLSVSLALAIAFVMIWIAYKPQVRTAATEQVEEAGTALVPSPSPSAPATVPSAEESPVEAVAPPVTEPSAEAGGGEGGDEASPSPPVKKKPPAVVPAQNILLRNTTTKKCADLPGKDKAERNGPVQQFTCDQNPADNQLWNLEVKYPGDGPGGTALFQIRNVKSQFCVDLPGWGAQPVRTDIIQALCAGTKTDNQLWWVEKQKSGAYWIRNYSSNNKCLDVSGWSTGVDETKLTLFDCLNTDDQEWEIIQPNQE